MRKWQCVIVSLVFMCGPALAADSVGEWLVADGGAHLRIESCADALWGIISWTVELGLESQNPFHTKPRRSISRVLHVRRRTSAGASRCVWYFLNEPLG